MKTAVVLFAFFAVLSLAAATDGVSVRRIFREPRHARGDLNMHVVQPFDEAAWIWHPAFTNEPSAHPPRFLRFSRRFTSDGAPLVLDVSADERFVLYLDGAFVARGPNRGTVENWLYQSYEIALPPGEHVLEAVCWTIGEFAPLAQLSWKGGFALKAEGTYDERLTTGKAAWDVAEIRGIVPTGTSKVGCWGAGSEFTVTGAFPERGGASVPVVVVRDTARRTFKYPDSGLRLRGWMPYPADLPDQTEDVRRPGRFVAAFEGTDRDRKYAQADADHALVGELNGLLRGGKAVLKPGTSFRAVWDLDDYICAYPQLTLSGGRGSRIEWAWAESLRDRRATGGPNKGLKGNRDAFDGKLMHGMTDVFLPDGRRGASFTLPWWRCGRWCELCVTVGDEPLELEGLEIVESRYPLACESTFSCEDRTLDGVQTICARVQQMCAHDMLFDGPYYEQQMYPGDSRVQLLVISAMTADDRLVRRAIELFERAARDDGLVPMNWPTRGLQESLTYTLCYAMMYGDYVRWHRNADWLRARLPGLRRTMFALAGYEDGDGLLGCTPGWPFVDWAKGLGGWKPDAPANALVNLFYALALRSAAEAERAIGEREMEKVWTERAERVCRSVVAKFWDEGRGLMADDLAHTRWSEHAQCLAMLAGALSPDQDQSAFAGLVSATDLTRTTVYFSHYLFETYLRHGRADLFLKRLDLWRDYVKLGLRTTLEMPGESRSDCHAWGAHPLYHLRTGVAGIRPSAPFFGAVEIAPCPGPLREIRASVPHPDGMIAVDLRFDGAGNVTGSVDLPKGLSGAFVWRGRRHPLVTGGHTDVAGLAETGDARLCPGVNGVYSPDGDRLAFEAERNGNLDLGIMDLGTRRIEWADDRPGHAFQPAWNAKGDAIVYTYGHETGTATANTNAPNGYNLWLWRADGRRQLTRGRERDYAASFSADSGRAYLVSTRNVPKESTQWLFANASRLFTLDLAKEGSEPLEFFRVQGAQTGVGQPTESPDGRFLLWTQVANLRAPWQVYAARRESPGDGVRLTGRKEHAYAPRWSPDGRLIAYTGFNVGDPGWCVYLMDAVTGAKRRLCPGRDPAFSPDGKRLVYDRDEVLYEHVLVKADLEFAAAEPEPDPTAVPERELLKVESPALPYVADMPDGLRIPADAVMYCTLRVTRKPGMKAPKKPVFRGEWGESRLGLQFFLSGAFEPRFSTRQWNTEMLEISGGHGSGVRSGATAEFTAIRTATEMFLATDGRIFAHKDFPGAFIALEKPRKLVIGEEFEGTVESVAVGLGWPKSVAHPLTRKELFK